MPHRFNRTEFVTNQIEAAADQKWSATKVMYSAEVRQPQPQKAAPPPALLLLLARSFHLSCIQPPPRRRCRRQCGKEDVRRDDDDTFLSRDRKPSRSFLSPSLSPSISSFLSVVRCPRPSAVLFSEEMSDANNVRTVRGRGGSGRYSEIFLPNVSDTLSRILTLRTKFTW